jgi:DNA mismatch repair protein MutS2
LQIGLPGRSNAFAIAERLGLARPIVEAARAYISQEELQTESLLAEIQLAHREAAHAREEALSLRRQAAEHERQLSMRLAGMDRECAAILDEARGPQGAGTGAP